MYANDCTISLILREIKSNLILLHLENPKRQNYNLFQFTNKITCFLNF